MYLRISKRDNKGQPAYKLHVGATKDSPNVADDRWIKEGKPDIVWIMSPETEKAINEAYYGYWV